MKNKIFVVVFALVLISIASFAVADNETELDDDAVFCTMDVQMCPDGSYVGRDPEKNCEFFTCPTQEDSKDDELEQENETEDEEENETELEDEDEIEDEEELLGASCGTVTPGYQNECCMRKGYQRWDDEEFKCIGERSKENIRQRIKFAYGSPQNEIECPEGCICSGSNIKCSFENGTRVMTVYAGNSGNVIVQVKNVNASTNVTLYKQDGKVYGTFKNNETKEIILPDEVMEKLKERNQKRLQLYNESIELDENGYYHVEMKKKARLFLLVPVREHVQAEIDAETGETIKIRNPWWGFLAKDIKEDAEDEEENSEQETED